MLLDAFRSYLDPGGSHDISRPFRERLRLGLVAIADQQPAGRQLGKMLQDQRRHLPGAMLFLNARSSAALAQALFERAKLVHHEAHVRRACGVHVILVAKNLSDRGTFYPL